MCAARGAPDCGREEDLRARSHGEVGLLGCSLLLMRVLGGPQQLDYAGDVLRQWQSSQLGRCGPNPEGRDGVARQFKRNSSPYSVGAGGDGARGCRFPPRRNRQGMPASPSLAHGIGRCLRVKA